MRSITELDLQYALEHVPHHRRSRLHAGTAHRYWIKAEVNKTVLPFPSQDQPMNYTSSESNTAQRSGEACMPFIHTGEGLTVNSLNFTNLSHFTVHISHFPTNPKLSPGTTYSMLLYLNYRPPSHGPAFLPPLFHLFSPPGWQQPQAPPPAYITTSLHHYIFSQHYFSPIFLLFSLCHPLSFPLQPVAQPSFPHYSTYFQQFSPSGWQQPQACTINLPQ